MKYLIVTIPLLFSGCAYTSEFKNSHDMDKLADCAEQAALQCERESRKVVVEPAPQPNPPAANPVN